MERLRDEKEDVRDGMEPSQIPSGCGLIFMRRESFGPEDIVVPERLRTRLDEAAVVGLMDSIKRIGLQTPPTVRWAGEDVVLVAGRHRLEAVRRMQMPLVEFSVIDGDEKDARLWEIAENLHRADLTVQERSEHIAEWVKLTAEKARHSAAPLLSGEQPAQVAPSVKKHGHAQLPSGVNAAVRELGIDRTEAQRATKIAAMPEEAKEAARELHLDDNQSALLAAARSANPVETLRDIAERKAVKPAPAPLNDVETEEQWMTAIMRVWNRAAPQWRERFLSTVDAPVFDNTRAA